MGIIQHSTNLYLICIRVRNNSLILSQKLLIALNNYLGYKREPNASQKKKSFQGL